MWPYEVWPLANSTLSPSTLSCALAPGASPLALCLSRKPIPGRAWPLFHAAVYTLVFWFSLLECEYHEGDTVPHLWRCLRRLEYYLVQNAFVTHYIFTEELCILSISGFWFLVLVFFLESSGFRGELYSILRKRSYSLISWWNIYFILVEGRLIIVDLVCLIRFAL